MSGAVWVGPLADVTITVEIAWGADLDDLDGSGWTWTDVTEHVRMRPGISTALGRGDEASRSQPAALTLVVDNRGADYSIGGHSPNWPNVRRGTPVRVQLDPGAGDPAGAGARVLFLGFADGFTPGWDAFGAIPVVTISASGTLRRLAQGRAPLFSAYRRYVERTSTLVAYWPMEEAQSGRGSEALYAPALTGGRPMLITAPATVQWAASDVFEASSPLPDVGDSAFVAILDPYTATGESGVSFFVVVPDDGLADGTILARVYTSGTLGRWDVAYELAGTGNLSLSIYNANGSLNTSSTAAYDMNGKRRRVELRLTQDGADVDWQLGALDATPGDEGTVMTGTVTTDTHGIVTQVTLTPNGDAAGTIIGHLRVQDSATVQDGRAAFWAWQRADGSQQDLEFASSAVDEQSRLTRLCAEENLQLTRFTNLGEPILPREGMGPQLVTAFVDLLAECEIIDQGQIWDGRSPGLTITTRRYREDGNVAISIDAGAGELAGPFEPQDDDQRTRNRVSATRTAGVTETYEDSTGPLRTGAAGIYDAQMEINGAHDSMALQHASWQVSLGTVEGYRYPTVTIDLRAAPQLAGALLDLVPGDVVAILNPDDALGAFAPLPSTGLRLMVEGIGHELNIAGWRAVLRCSPASPWIVGQVAAESGDTGAYLLRPDTDGCELVLNAPANTTALYVANTDAPWTTDSDDYPFVLDVGGLPVTATAAGAAADDPAFGVAGAYLAGAGGRTTSSVPVPAGVADGSFVLVHLYVESSTTVTPPAGFTALPEQPFTAGPTTGLRTWWKRATGADAGTYDFTHSAMFTEGVATRYEGILQAGSPHDADVGSAARSSADTATPAVELTTSGPGRLIVWAATSVATGAWTPPAGYTERVDTGGELTVATVTLAAEGSTGSLVGAGPSGFMTAYAVALIPEAQQLTVTALDRDLLAGVPVRLWDPRPLAL